jgi:hypothetical protein
MSKPPAAIVVCPGLAARFLGGVEDKDMYPIRGQTLLLRAPWVREGHTLTAENGVRVYTIPRRGGDVSMHSHLLSADARHASAHHRRYEGRRRLVCLVSPSTGSNDSPVRQVSPSTVRNLASDPHACAGAGAGGRPTTSSRKPGWTPASRGRTTARHRGRLRLPTSSARRGSPRRRLDCSRSQGRQEDTDSVQLRVRMCSRL